MWNPEPERLVSHNSGRGVVEIEKAGRYVLFNDFPVVPAHLRMVH